MNRISVQYAVPNDPERFDNRAKGGNCRCTD
jgi:hypothetical protein